MSRPWVRWSVLWLRYVVPALALSYLFSIVPYRAAIRSAARLSLAAIPLAFGALLASSIVGTFRWRLLLSACGVESRPKYGELFRAYWIGTFYSTCVPGGVGGEVVRALATRRVVGERGLPLALAIVFLDRTCGLTGLLILLSVSVALFPANGVGNVLLYSGLGMCVVVAAVLAIVNGPRLARFLPGPIAKIASALPTIQSLPLFAIAVLLSVVTQLLGVVYGHIVISGITPIPSFRDSVMILPLINASQYFPLTVGGAGVREYGFVMLYGKLHVAQPDALAAGVLCGVIAYVASALGGILHLLKPLTLELADTTPIQSAQPAQSSASQP